MSGDRQTETKIRRTIESAFLGEAEKLDYELALISFDPIEYYKSGEIHDRTVLAHYGKGHYAN